MGLLLLHPIVFCAEHRAVHRIQWDEAQVIHEEENRITTELKELVLITRSDSQANALAPYDSLQNKRKTI
jgi:hypothetical protein